MEVVVHAVYVSPYTLETWELQQEKPHRAQYPLIPKGGEEGANGLRRITKGGE